ncbi:hypothetical protein [Planomonospora algeriensis]
MPSRPIPDSRRDPAEPLSAPRPVVLPSTARSAATTTRSGPKRGC